MKNKKWVWIGLVLIAVVAGGSYLFFRSEGEKTVYTEVKVQRADVGQTILATGTVQPENRVGIKPPIAGRVEQVLVVEGQKVKKGQMLAWMSSTERAALLDAAISKGPAELKEWENLYKATPILAPINGTIIQRNVESGQTFATTDEILVMSDRLTVKAQVDETDIAQVQLKQKAVIVLDAYPGKSIPASVDQIAFDAKTVNNVTNYLIDVLPNQTPDEMRSGMTANVTFQISLHENVLTVPTAAVKAQDGRSSVLVRDASAKEPVEKEFEAGLSDGKKTEVLSGLSEGDVILMPEFHMNKKTKASSPFGPQGPRGRK